MILPSSEKALRADLQNEVELEYREQDWSKAYLKIDMFAVKLNQEGGFNIKSFNKVSNIALLPNQKARMSTFKKY